MQLRLRIRRILPLLLATLSFVITSTAWAAPVLPTPGGLNAGDRFRYLFVTTGKIAATSSDIATYNAFVQADAGGATYQGVVVNWKAIGSTATVNARDNVGGFGDIVPVYTMPGFSFTKVAVSLTESEGGLWSLDLLTQPRQDINGADSLEQYVWTGSQPTGVGLFEAELGGPLGITILGNNQATGDRWTSDGDDLSTKVLPMYGLSETLTVPSAVPEIDPAGMGSVIVLVSGALGLLERRRRAFVAA